MATNAYECLLRFIGEVLVCKQENGYEPRHSFDVSIYNHNCNMHYGQQSSTTANQNAMFNQVNMA